MRRNRKTVTGPAATIPALHARSSPNHDARPRQAVIDMIVIHYTGMRTGEEALARLTDPQARVSAHYLIEEDGRIFALVPEERRAWHAGVAAWAGLHDINARSIGIELVNPGHEFGYRPFPDRQIAALIALIRDIRRRWPVPDSRILGHSDVAPLRKQDPGELFPWDRLAAAGIGLWPAKGKWRTHGRVAPLSALAAFGYGWLAEEDAQATAAVVRAFQRHFRPEQINGHWDEECGRRLAWLLAAKKQEEWGEPT